MTYQNRVDPAGNFHAVPTKGTLMGNRGILHDDTKTIIRPHNHQNWVTCALSFKGRQRPIMGPEKYTELFFLDEATAFAAGHRPCAECRRERYREFTEAWLRTHGIPEAGRTLPQTIDKALHSRRINRKRQKVVFSAPVSSLPDGTFFLEGDDIVLYWQERQLLWSFEGYEDRAVQVSGDVSVLTPSPLVEVFKNGFTPDVRAD
jgi:hypothetical protein